MVQVRGRCLLRLPLPSRWLTIVTHEGGLEGKRLVEFFSCDATIGKYSRATCAKTSCVVCGGIMVG